MSEIKVTQELDCSGMNCPLPVVKTAQMAKTLKKGNILKVIATDPGSEKDMPAWSRRTGNKIMETSKQDDKFIYIVKIK
ncbi:MAG: sulfurtransferase TusA family protein [Leptospirales bacterium]